MADGMGKVWLVGAGPGAAGLLTVKGRRVLDEADVIVHDALVSDELLSGLPSQKLISVGKRAGYHPVSQPQINDLLIREARNGKRVVRLKGGDPFVFGRGGEEMLALSEAGIPVEMVPGISSALAVPAYSGVPVTHRGLSALVHILAWHGEASPPSIKTLEALAASGGTLVILMGAQSSAEVGVQLITAGYRPSQVAMIIENGTTCRQRETTLTLREMAFSVNRETVKAPAVIVVGEVCELSGALSWVRGMPLFGVRVVVTRPRPQNDALCEKLRGLGAEAISFPCIETVAVRVEVDKLAAVRGYAWLAFTSAAGVEAFFGSLLDAGMDSRLLANTRVAAIGPATAEALRSRGILPDYVPQTYDAHSLGTGLVERMERSGRVLLVRAEQGSEELAAALLSEGIEYDELPVYRTKPVEEVAADIVQQGRFDYVLFASASTVCAFVQRVPDINFAEVHAVCIGEPTAQEARARGMRVTVARQATAEGLCDALVTLNRKGYEYGEGI